jgi:hypothetical protein
VDAPRTGCAGPGQGSALMCDRARPVKAEPRINSAAPLAPALTGLGAPASPVRPLPHGSAGGRGAAGGPAAVSSDDELRADELERGRATTEPSTQAHRRASPSSWRVQLFQTNCSHNSANPPARTAEQLTAARSLCTTRHHHSPPFSRNAGRRGGTSPRLTPSNRTASGDPCQGRSEAERLYTGASCATLGGATALRGSSNSRGETRRNAPG